MPPQGEAAGVEQRGLGEGAGQLTLGLAGVGSDEVLITACRQLLQFTSQGGAALLPAAGVTTARPRGPQLLPPAPAAERGRGGGAA